MAIITAAEMLTDMIGPMVNTGDLGLPETPDNWGAESGGYINDYPVPSPGGFQNGFGIYRIFPWFVSLAEKTYDPTGANFRVQVRLMRASLRSNSTTAWTLQQTINDPNFDSGGGSASSDYRFPGDVNYAFAETGHGGFAGRLVTMSSGGSAVQHINDWCMHGFPMNMIQPNYSAQDCIGVTMQIRFVPIDEANDFDWANYRVSGYVGTDNYGGSWVAEHAHSAFKRITNKWQVLATATVARPNWSNQGPGLTVDQYNSSPLPIPPEEHVWLERGAFNSGTNKQTLVLKRSAVVSGSGRVYTLTKKRGSFTLPMASVTIAPGADSIQFDVDTPGGAIAGSNTLYATDSTTGTSAEDHWGTFTIGSGTATGGSSNALTATFKGFDVNALMTTAALQPQGQQKAKYSADVAAQIGTNPIVEIRINATVIYRSTISGSMTSSSSGIAFPTQFTEPPSLNVANALTDANAVIVLRNASNAAIEILIPVKAGGAAGFLTASAALDGTKTVRTSGLLLVPPASLS